MRQLLGIGVSVGVLAGVWTFVSVELTLVTWVAFVAWACFFAAGGGRVGFTKGLAANLAGLFWGWVIGLGLDHLSSSTLALAVMVTVVGFVLCVEAAWPVLSFIPGGFVGTAAYFGTAFDFRGTLIAIVAGACLGWLSEVVAAQLQRRITPAADARHLVEEEAAGRALPDQPPASVDAAAPSSRSATTAGTQGRPVGGTIER